MRADPIALSVTRADGSVVRWGPDELNPENAPTGLSWETSIPGGYKTLSCALLRNYQADHPDQALFDNVRAYGRGNKTLWDGRMHGFPAEYGDHRQIRPQAVGWSAHLLDFKAFREIYVDRDPSKWGPSSLAERSQRASTYALRDAQVLPDGGFAALNQSFAAPWPASPLPLSQAWYDANGIAIGSLYYAWKRGSNVSAADASFAVQAKLLTGDNVNLSSIDQTGDMFAAGPVTGTLLATASNRTYAALQFYYETGPGGGASGTQYDVNWTCLAVYGRHGLTKRGAGTATSAPGFYACDMLADVVGRGAPLLTFTTGPTGSIQPSTFIIEHAPFIDPLSPSDVVSRLNAYHLYEWGVYDHREFFWRPPDPARLTWRARLSNGAKITPEGEDAANIYNGVVVTFSDPTGRKQMVGPPGTPGATQTDASLADTSPANPVNAHGIPQRYALLELSSPATVTGAIQIGAVYLRERSQASRRGTLTLTGTVTHPTMGERPVSEVRAGDYVQLADRPGDPVRRIISSRYDHDRRQHVCELDNTVFRVEALLERIGISLVGVL